MRFWVIATMRRGLLEERELLTGVDAERAEKRLERDRESDAEVSVWPKGRIVEAKTGARRWG